MLCLISPSLIFCNSSVPSNPVFNGGSAYLTSILPEVMPLLFSVCSKELPASLSRVDRKSNSSVAITLNAPVVKSGCASSTSVSSFESSVPENSLPLLISTFFLLALSNSQTSSITSLNTFHQNSHLAVHWTSNIFLFLRTFLAEGFFLLLKLPRDPHQASTLTEASHYYLPNCCVPIESY